MRILLPAALSITVSLAPAAQADTVATLTNGSRLLTQEYGFGQSFVTAAGANYDDITFNFYTTTHVIAPPIPNYYFVDLDFPETPFTIGTGYLFSQPYLGTVPNLGPSAPGFVGSAQASGDLYTFASSLTLSGNTTYYLYENSYTPLNTFIFMAGGGPISEYSGYDPNYFYQMDGIDSNFLVTGVPVSVTPEPSSLLLLGSATLAMGGMLRRRFR